MIARVPIDDRFARWLWIAVWAFAFLIAIATSLSGFDAFRYPKDLLFLAEAIILAAAVAVAALVRGSFAFFSLDPAVHWLLVAIVAWTAVATIASTNRLLSIFSFGWVLAAAVIFFVASSSARSGNLWPVNLLLLGTLVNAVIFVLQEFVIWSPFEIARSDPRFGRQLVNPALLGNPNDVGVFLIPGALAALALVAAERGRRRWWYAAVAIIASAAVFLSNTLTAVAGLAAGLVALGLTRLGRKGLMVSAVLLLLGAGAIAAYPPARQEVAAVTRLARAGQLNEALSNRLGAFAASVEMVRDRPLTGVGPGTFGWQFLPYRLRAEEKNPDLLRAWNRHINFDQAHNDHLQTAAVAGIPGYALFLAAMVFLGVRSFRHDDLSDPRHRFASVLAFPLAVSFFVVAIAQFPLELAAPLNAYILLAAACVSWSEVQR